MRAFICIVILFFVFLSCKEGKEADKLRKEWSTIFGDDVETASASNYSDSVPPNNTEATINIKPAKEIKPTTAFNSGNKREDLVDFAKQYIGTSYSFACATPEEGFDCSGFLYYVYSHFGYEVPRSSKEYEFFGKEIPIEEAKKGDLLLFSPTENDASHEKIGHIGILINKKGMASDFIHSSSGKANGVTISSLGSHHYTKRFVKAINIMD